MSPRAKGFRPVTVVAVFLAYLVPGAGHIYLGRVARGVIILVTIGATFWAGMCIGGVTTMDRRYDRWWFAAQMLNGVHGLIGWQMHEGVHRRLQIRLSEDPRYLSDRARLRRDISKAGLEAFQRPYLDKLQADEGIALVAPGETIARAYAGVAGMLNLLCVFDALMLSLIGVSGQGAAAGPRKEPKTVQLS